jgi:hypothetical protein
MSKTLSWTRSGTAHPAGSLARRAAAAGLRTASYLLVRLARRLRRPAPAAPLHLPVVEFHPSHREAGAPEGALYVDGELVGYVSGVTRL